MKELIAQFLNCRKCTLIGIMLLLAMFSAASGNTAMFDKIVSFITASIGVSSDNLELRPIPGMKVSTN